VVREEEGIEEVLEDLYIHILLYTFGNGTGLKDSSLLWCIFILLNVKGKIFDFVQVGRSLETVFLHFF
jgi:hypothetical protein